jgi:2-keto-3-deoxy-L-rhamnonate aldolase RhmA
MNGHEFSSALRGGRRVYGTLVVSPAPEWPIAVRKTGVDFVFIDTEHIALDRSQVSWMCRAYAALGILPVVRIPSPDPYLAAMAVDGGAAGVVAPYIETAAEVRRLVGAVRYAPLKGGRLSGILGGIESADSDLARFLVDSNRDRSVIVNIESTPAIEVLDEILAVPGLDAVLIGPHDLSVSLGIPRKYEEPLFTGAVDEIIRRARAAGVGAGMHSMFPAALRHELRMAAAGANLFIHQGDILAFQISMQRDIEELRETLGDTAPPAAADGRSAEV